MSQQRTQLILKLAKAKQVINVKSAEVWEVLNLPLNSSDDHVRKDAIIAELLSENTSIISTNKCLGYDLENLEQVDINTDIHRDSPMLNATAKEPLNETLLSSSNLCENHGRARDMKTDEDADDNLNKTISYNDGITKTMTDKEFLNIHTGSTFCDNKENEETDVNILNNVQSESSISNELLTTQTGNNMDLDEAQEDHVNLSERYNLIEEESECSKEYERPIRHENIDVSLSNYSDSDSDSSDEEPFGSGGSEADPDFQAPNLSSPLSVESEEDIQNKVLSKRRLVKFPSDAEKKSRKRKKNSREWQKIKAKRLRNTGQTYESIRINKKNDGSIERLKVKRSGKKMSDPCGEKCRLKCSSKMSQAERQKIFDEYWQLGDLQKQRSFISSRLIEIKPKYRYQNIESKRRLNTSFFFDSNGTNVRVCKHFFMSTLAINGRTIRTVIDKQESMTKGILKPEMRGQHGNHFTIPVDIKEGIKAHINSIPRIPSHYCRSQTKKEYIEGGKTIAKIYRDYKLLCQENNKPYGNYLMYYKIFNENFNIGLFSPKKDQCELCLAFTNASQEEKQQMQGKYDTHLKEKDLARLEKKADKESDKVVVVFDLQAISPCPTGNASGFYYISKLNNFNLTMYELQKNQAYCYLWHEAEANRGANEIGSCVWDYLKKMQENGINSKDSSDPLDIVFYTDNCTGQNKNRFIIALYMYAVLNLKFIKSITHKFLITGHTQNEGDHVHALIEKAVAKSRKSAPIYVPEHYAAIIRQAKKTGKSFFVNEMCHRDMFDLKDLSIQLGMKPTFKNENGETVKMSEIKMLMVKQESPGVLFYKYSYEEKEFSEVNILNNRRQQLDFSSIKVRNAYKQKVGITEKKKKSILSLFSEKPEKRIIPMYYFDYYNKL